MYRIQEKKKFGIMIQDIKELIILTAILMILLLVAMGLTTSLMNAIGWYILF